MKTKKTESLVAVHTHTHTDSLKNNRGITLVALVVTIVVLLILAAVSINLLLGENGLILQAQKAKKGTRIAETDELLNMAIASAQTEGLGELTDKGLRKNLDSTLGGAGKDYIISGDETNGWTIKIDEKEYIINPTGTKYEKVEGSIVEWEVTGNAVTKYLGTSNDIVVPNYVEETKITEIGDNIFKNSDKTGTLKISEGIEKIGKYAFGYSKFTGSLLIPGSVKEIKEAAFASCKGFNILTLNSGIEIIGTAAFNSCSSFTGNLIIPESVNTIGIAAFSSCSGFTGNLNIPGTVKTIEQSAFSSCKGFNGTLTLNYGIKKIGDVAFSECTNFTGDIVIPGSVEEIDSAIFNNCTGFNGKLVIEEGTKGVAYVAFSGLSVSDLIIQNNINMSTGTSVYGSNFTGTLYIGKNSKVMLAGGEINIKRAIMYSIPTDYYGIQYFKQLKICWISKDAISNINTLAIQEEGVAPSSFQIYTDASSDDVNWPADFPKDSLPNGITVNYNTSEEDFRNLEY